MSKTYNITLLPGDGIGPEVITESVKVLDAVADKSGFSLEYTTQNAGGAAIDAHNDPMPDSVIAICKASDAVLLGAVGGPKWDALTGAMRPESGLLKIRKELGAFANLRPVTVPASLAQNSPLRPETVSGLDLFTVRELTGGIYFGEPVGESGEGFVEVDDIEQVERQQRPNGDKIRVPATPYEQHDRHPEDEEGDGHLAHMSINPPCSSKTGRPRTQGSRRPIWRSQPAE